MCTHHCPCYLAQAGNHTVEASMLAYGRFEQVNEAYMNLRGRTWNATTKGDRAFLPFVWTTNRTMGVTTFEQCLNNHFKDDMSQPELTLVAEKFGIHRREMGQIN